MIWLSYVLAALVVAIGVVSGCLTIFHVITSNPVTRKHSELLLWLFLALVLIVAGIWLYFDSVNSSTPLPTTATLSTQPPISTTTTFPASAVTSTPLPTPTVPPTPTSQLPTPTVPPTPTSQPPTPTATPTTVLLCSALRNPPSAFTVLSGGFAGGSNNCNGEYSVTNTPTQAQATWEFNFSPVQGTSQIMYSAYIPANTDGARVDYVLYDCSGAQVFDDANIPQANGERSQWLDLFTFPSLCVGKIVVWSGTHQANRLYVDAFSLTVR